MGRRGVISSLTLFVFFALAAFRLGAQEQSPAPEPVASARATGAVRTPNGVPIPGANLRLVETSSGRAWISWTDENGHFDLPGLPAGHYRMEVSQLGFESGTQEFDLGNSVGTVNVTLTIASLESIETAAASGPSAQNLSQTPAGAGTPANPAANAAGGAQQAPGQASSGTGGLRRRQFPGGGGPPGAGQNGQNGAGTQRGTAPGPGGPGSGGQGFGGRRGGFQQVILNNQTGAEGQEGEAAQGPEGAGPGDQGTPGGPLGQAASADAVLMNGTVGQGDQNAGFGGGFPPGGIFLQGPGDAGQGGFGGTGGGFRGGAPVAQPGGAGGPGAPGGGPGGGPVIAFRPQGGGRPGPGGRGAPPQGVPALFGMQRVLRQRINRVRLSFYNEYSNSVFNARPYSLNQPNPPKIPTWSERIGGNLGGPLVIPHLYDGHDKTFFFVNFDSTWARNAVDQFSTVPTQAQRAGNFCDPSAMKQLNIPNFGGPVCQIPSNLLDPVAQQLLQFIPEPNLPGLVDNFHLQTQVPTQQDRLNVRVLHSISPKLNARVFYGFNQSSNHAFQSFPGFESDAATRGQSVTLGLTQNLSRTWINDSQFIFSRNRVQTLDNFAFSDPVSQNLGITNVSGAPIDYGPPQLSFNNFTKAAPAVPSLVRNQTYRFVDGVTYMLPKHTLTFGAEVRRIENNTNSDQTPEGLFTFTGLVTGFDFADFLLGYPYTTNERFGNPSSYFRSWGTAGYASDDWRMRPDFTLQFGVRYEFFTPPTELYGHLSNLDFDPATSKVALVAPGCPPAASLTPGLSCLPAQDAPFSGALPNSLIRPSYNNWAPRVGIAWRPAIKALQGKHSTVVRAGFSMFYNESIYTQLLSELANQPPWSTSQLRITSFTNPSDVLTLEEGFPSTVAARNTIQNTYAVNPNYQVGYAQIWNLSVETNVANNTALVLTYTGTKGTNLDLLYAPNRAALGSLSPSGPVANAGNFIYDTSGANSIYNSLQVRVQKRLSHGIMINGTYTYAKSIDDASSIGGGTPIVVQDANNLAAEYGLSSFDIRHQVRLNYLYELPFGEGHRFAQKGLSAALLGNWRFSGNIGVQSGTPYTAEVMGTSAANTGSGGVFATRADQICSPNLPAGEIAPLHFFDTSCFVAPPAGQLGNAARNTITGPGLFIWNAQFGKTIPFGKDHEHRLDLRWEITNVTNTPNFTGLSTLVNSTTFGQVMGASAMRAMNVVTRFTF
jgi:hypothetical protein